MKARDALLRMTNAGRTAGPRSREAVATLPTALRSVLADRAELRRLAESQAALRHVATLVARGVTPAEAFTTVAAELGRLVGADLAGINRYETDQTVTIVASWSASGDGETIVPPGHRYPYGRDTTSAAVLRTGRATRAKVGSIGGHIGDWARTQGFTTVVSCPIWVEGRLWGQMVLMFRGPDPPAQTENRLEDFVELVACTIAQAKARTDLVDSRARVIEAADETRRRIERDLHDGVQQHLVSIGFDIRSAVATVPPDEPELRKQLAGTVEDLTEVIAEVQEISRGLHPGVLARSGLVHALKVLTRRAPIPVELTADLPKQLPDRLEVTTYYIISEALANVLKHADASKVRIHVGLDGAEHGLCVEIQDDGRGGADPADGSGLVGLNDRVEAMEGTMRVNSPAGQGTSVVITLPVEATSDWHRV